MAKPPAGPGWAHEIKFDGYRMQMRIEGSKATLLTRKGLDWSEKFSAITAAGADLPDGIINGEVVALDHSGVPDFAALQVAIADGKTKELVFSSSTRCSQGRRTCARCPSRSGRSGCKQRSSGRRANIRYVDHFVRAGDAILRSACRRDLEGIVSKRLDAPYQSGRGDSWIVSQ